jgi:hypothetical protein
MRTLIYIPIIHSSADLGSIGKDVAKRGKAGLGEDVWKAHTRTVDGFWDIISKYFLTVDAQGMKVYQDGMVADGEIGRTIVEEVLKTGSKNYEVIAGLLRKGAILMKTEDLSLVKEERDRILKITQAGSTTKKLIGFLKYRLTKNRLLDERDRFIAKQINETLKDGETGVLFIGAYHNVKAYLSRDIQCKDLKDVQQVRDYHRLLPFPARDRERFEKLSQYLITDIADAPIQTT